MVRNSRTLINNNMLYSLHGIIKADITGDSNSRMTILKVIKIKTRSNNQIKTYKH